MHFYIILPRINYALMLDCGVEVVRMIITEVEKVRGCTEWEKRDYLGIIVIFNGY